jgi:hypothetical protein
MSCAKSREARMRFEFQQQSRGAGTLRGQIHYCIRLLEAMGQKTASGGELSKVK